MHYNIELTIAQCMQKIYYLVLRCSQGGGVGYNQKTRIVSCNINTVCSGLSGRNLVWFTAAIAMLLGRYCSKSFLLAKPLLTNLKKTGQVTRHNEIKEKCNPTAEKLGERERI